MKAEPKPIHQNQNRYVRLIAFVSREENSTKSPDSTAARVEAPLGVGPVLHEGHPIHGQLRLVGIRIEDLPADILEDLPDHDLEGDLDVRGVQRRGLHEEEALLFRERLSFLLADLPDVVQVALVPDQHPRDGSITVSCNPMSTQKSRVGFGKFTEGREIECVRVLISRIPESAQMN